MPANLAFQDITRKCSAWRMDALNTSVWNAPNCHFKSCQLGSNLHSDYFAINGTKLWRAPGLCISMKPPRRIRIAEGSFVLAGCVNLLGTYEEFMLISHTYENCLHSFSTLTHEFYNYFDLPHKKPERTSSGQHFSHLQQFIGLELKSKSVKIISWRSKRCLEKHLLFIPKARSRESETNTLSSQDTYPRFWIHNGNFPITVQSHAKWVHLQQ